MGQRRYVSTSRDGRSRGTTGEVRVDVPQPGQPPSGAPFSVEGPHLALRTLQGLLGDLGERIFVAEAAGPEPAEPAEGPELAEGAGPVEPAGGAGAGSAVQVADGQEGPDVWSVRAARLVGETGWDDAAAARFALECAEHAVGDGPEVVLPHGYTLGGVLADVRGAVERAEAPAPAVGWLGRMAALRRLRRDGAALADLATLAAKEDEGAGIDLLDDPAWTRLAAVEEAVLAAAEAVRFLSHPGRVAAQEEVEARRLAGVEPAEPDVEETPWGWVSIGSSRVPAYRSAARSAEHAAERARQAARDAGGPAAEAAEVEFQLAVLARLLGGEEGAAPA